MRMTKSIKMAPPKASAGTPSKSMGATSAPKLTANQFSRLSQQNISGGTRTGAAPVTLPSGNITRKMISSISAGQFKPGQLGSYQQRAITLMEGSGRSMEFMRKNLNQVTAMQMPNYNLPQNLAGKAVDMRLSGRTQSFVRSQLGVSQNTPVPGRPG